MSVCYTDVCMCVTQSSWLTHLWDFVDVASVSRGSCTGITGCKTFSARSIDWTNSRFRRLYLTSIYSEVHSKRRCIPSAIASDGAYHQPYQLFCHWRQKGVKNRPCVIITISVCLQCDIKWITNTRLKLLKVGFSFVFIWNRFYMT